MSRAILRLATSHFLIFSKANQPWMMNIVRADRRDPYGYLRTDDDSSNALMVAFIASGKRLITYWADHIRSFTESHMAYDTFRRRVGKYLKKTKAVLSPFQQERVRMPSSFFQYHAIQYLHLVQSGVAISGVKYFELYVIVPPYDIVPSYEQFEGKLKAFLCQQPVDNLNVPMMAMATTVAGDHAFAELELVAEVADKLEPIPLPVATENTVIMTDYESEPLTDIEYATDVESVSDREIQTELSMARASGGVAIVYRCVQKATGSLGGNGSGGPIYGELTVGSMQNVVNYLVRYCNFSWRSRFLDVGSGRGKPNFHVAQDPGVRLSIGIEVEPIRYSVRFLL
jgi:hypothetical protein